MSDDIPIPEVPDSEIWAKRGLDSYYSSDVQRMAEFVREAAGDALTVEPTDELLKKPPHELFALAVQAQQAGLSGDVVASLLVFAIGRGSTLAAAALGQIVGQRLEYLSHIKAAPSARRVMLRIRRQIDRRLGQKMLVEKFDEFRKELDATGEAVLQGKIWQEFRRSGVDRAAHRLIAPNLKSLKHLEAADEFKPLMAPLPLWRSPVSPIVLASVLALEFPHFSTVVDDIAQFVAGGSRAAVRPLLLVGPAGIGKDSILRRAAELVGRPFGEYDVAGTSDNRIVKGTSKGWSTATPSHVATICARFRCANPLVLYCELDRSGGSRRNGMVNEAFLGLCEPSTRSRWYDDGLGTELDLSDVAVAFSSNGVDDTPGPLLTRLRILKLERPKAEHVAGILQQSRRRLADELKVPVDSLPEPTPQVVQQLEAVARQGRFHLRLADRVVRALSSLPTQKPLN